MIRELTNLIRACPSVQNIEGGICIDYLDGNYGGICIKNNSGIETVHKYLDGYCLLKQDFKVEIYQSLSGSTEESITNHEIIEQLQNEIEISPIPQIREGKIIDIFISDGGRHIKSAVGEGILFFTFSVLYKAKREGDTNA